MTDQELKFRVSVEADDAVKGLDNTAQATEKVTQKTKESAQVAEQATQQEKTREQQLKELRQRLDELAREEAEVERATKAGARTTEDTNQKTAARRNEIKRIKAALREEGEVQDRVNQITHVAATETSGLTSVLGGATQAIQTFAAGFLGAAGVNQLVEVFNERLRANNEYLKENARLTREAAESRLDLVAMSGVERDEDVQFIGDTASFAGRRPAEVARLWTMYKSQFPGATDDQLRQLVTVTAAKGQQTTASLPELGASFTTLFRHTNDAVTAGNILEAVIDKAGEDDAGKLGPYLAKFLGSGKAIGGLDVGEASGFVAAGTGLGLQNEVAMTGLERVVLAIRGAGTPQGQEILEREGINRNDLIAGMKGILAKFRAGNISRAELEQVGGAEALRIFATLADPAIEEEFFGKVAAVDAAEGHTGFDIGDKAKTMFPPGSIQNLNLLSKQQESRTESVRSNDPRAARADAGRQIMDRVLAEAVAAGKISPREAEVAKDLYDQRIAMGGTPEDAAYHAQTSVGLITEIFGAWPAVLGAPTFGDLNGVPLGLEVKRGLQQGADIEAPGISGGGKTIIQQQNIYNIAQNYQGLAVPPSERFTGRDQDF